MRQLFTTTFIVLFATTVAVAQPGNDDCGNADPLIPGAPVFTFGATTDGPDLAGFCDPGPGDDQVYNDVWYCWTAPIDGVATLNLFSFLGGGRVAVYESCACPATPASAIACGQSLTPFDPLVFLDFTVVAGESYLIQVGSQDASTFVDGVLELFVPLPLISNLVCDDSTPGEVAMTWDLPSGFTFDSIEIQLSGTFQAALPATATDYVFVIPPSLPVPYTLCVLGLTPGGSSVTCCTLGIVFPPADDCATASSISTGQQIDIDTSVASTDGPDLAPFCDPGPGADDQIYNDLWFCWTAPSSGPHIVSGLSFAEPLRVGVYLGCDCPADPSTIEACGQFDPGAGSAAGVPFVATAGESYLIRVGTASSVGLGLGFVEVTSNVPFVAGLVCDDTIPDEINLSWSIPAGASYDAIEVTLGGAVEATLPGTDTSYTYVYPTGFAGGLTFGVRGVIGGLASLDTLCLVVLGGPDNDDCADAQLVTAGETPFDTSFATDGLAIPILFNCVDPTGVPAFIFQDIWFRYVAAQTTTATFSLCGSSFDTALALYEDIGICPADLEIACDTNSCGLQSEIQFDIIEGTTYLVRVGSDFDLITGVIPSGLGTLTIDDGTTPVGALFRRGDVNIDGGFDISDPVSALAVLFTIGTPTPLCIDAADINDDGGFDISDAVYALAALFTIGSPAPPAPGAITCGEDLTADTLECVEYAACP